MKELEITVKMPMTKEFVDAVIDGVHAKIKAETVVEKVEVPANWIKPKEAAELLKCNVRTVKKRINQEGYYKGKLFGKHWKIDKNSLDEYMRTN